MTSVTILDTETTGLLLPSSAKLEKQPRIIELFMLYGNLVLEGDTYAIANATKWHSLFDPGLSLPPVITRITGLCDADLAGKPTFKSKAREVKDILGESDIIVGHNISFDWNMIINEFRRAEEKLYYINELPELVCTVEHSEHLTGQRLKLVQLYDLLFRDSFSAHRAEDDVNATTRCFLELLSRGEIVL